MSNERLEKTRFDVLCDLRKNWPRMQTETIQFFDRKLKEAPNDVVQKAVDHCLEHLEWPPVLSHIQAGIRRHTPGQKADDGKKGKKPGDMVRGERTMTSEACAELLEEMREKVPAAFSMTPPASSLSQVERMSLMVNRIMVKAYRNAIRASPIKNEESRMAQQEMFDGGNGTAKTIGIGSGNGVGRGDPRPDPRPADEHGEVQDPTGDQVRVLNGGRPDLGGRDLEMQPVPDPVQAELEVGREPDGPVRGGFDFIEGAGDGEDPPGGEGRTEEERALEGLDQQQEDLPASEEEGHKEEGSDEEASVEQSEDIDRKYWGI